MILSASRRTDIPAFFSDWFYNRIEKGFVLVRNPMNIHQISRVSLRPEVVDCIVFWTKNPKPFIARLPHLAKYNYYFQYTMTGYGKRLEPNTPSVEESINFLRSLSKSIGSTRVIWRYDPIIITDEHTIKFHIKNFSRIAQNLAGLTKKCVISFVDYYKKTAKNMSNINYSGISDEDIFELSGQLANIARRHGIMLASCAEEIDLEKQGIVHGKCIDDKLIEEISGYSLDIGKDKNQREECGCMASIDIGAYNTCPHGCLYCYANYDLNMVRRNYALHDKNSDLIYGIVSDRDKISERKVLSCKAMQQSLFGNNAYSQPTNSNK